jgi:hypothetical protein
MLAVSVKIFRGDAKTIIRENTSLLQDAPMTLRLGFPDVVFPGDIRNELYIKLWSGDFTSSHSGSGRLSVTSLRGQMGQTSNNVQVTIEVRDQDGRPVENIISQGSGEPLMTQFHSMVFQRNNQPTYGELIKVQLPLQGVLIGIYSSPSGTALGGRDDQSFRTVIPWIVHLRLPSSLSFLTNVPSSKMAVTSWFFIVRTG